MASFFLQWWKKTTNSQSPKPLNSKFHKNKISLLYHMHLTSGLYFWKAFRHGKVDQKLVHNGQTTKFLIKGYKIIPKGLLNWIFCGVLYHYYKHSKLWCQNDTFKEAYSKNMHLNLFSNVKFMILNTLNLIFFQYSFSS